MTGTCKHCGCQLYYDGRVWVDNTGGDVCGHDGANAPHEDISDTADTAAILPESDR